MLLGHTKSFPVHSTQWIEQWYASQALTAGLNQRQKEALLLPFQEKIGFIQGPPGTGKTHLLVWTLISLLAHARHLNRPIKILVSAQTHHTIDQILKKTAQTIPLTGMSDVSLWKYGRFDDRQFSHLGIGQMEGTQALYHSSSLILGATGYGVYQLLENKNFPRLFDWVVFDEASQILPPYALLNLIFGKGQALFYGDTQQLSPVLQGNYEGTALPPRSILEELSSRYSLQNRFRLNQTYRMISTIVSPLSSYFRLEQFCICC